MLCLAYQKKKKKDTHKSAVSLNLGRERETVA